MKNFLIALPAKLLVMTACLYMYLFIGLFVVSSVSVLCLFACAAYFATIGAF